MRRRARGGVWLLLALALPTCRNPQFQIAELPEAPIAIVYRTVQETERVQEVLEEAERKKHGTDKPEPGHLKVLEVERLEQLAGLRTAEDSLRDQLGRVRFYLPPTGRLEPAEFAPRGARPLEWSADHTRLLFSAAANNRLQLFEWLVASGEVRQLTRGDWPHPDGCYGPDGAFAYVETTTRKGQPPSSRIWIQRAGEAARPVTEGPADFQPSWSRDGSRLVYATYERARGDLLRWVDPASGESGMLTRGRSPVFAPDGQWIVYSAHTGKGWKLWRMRADGSGKRSFGSSAFHENDPAVSPDGRFVVFAGTKQERSASSRLFVRPFDGTPDRQLELSGTALLPVW